MKIREIAAIVPISNEQAREIEEDKELFQELLQSQLELMFAREVKSIARDIVKGDQ